MNYLITALHPFPSPHQVVSVLGDLSRASEVAERLSETEPRSKFSVVDKKTRETLRVFGPLNPPTGPGAPSAPHTPEPMTGAAEG